MGMIRRVPWGVSPTTSGGSRLTFNVQKNSNRGASCAYAIEFMDNKISSIVFFIGDD
jgi:hypothetical protein